MSNPSGTSDVTISAPDYEFLRTLLRKEIGFDLGIDRQYLVVNRLVPIVAMFDCRDIGHLIDRARQSQERRLIEAVAESMTINETSFFRGGQKLFDNLAQFMIPALQRTRSSTRRLRIWSGACATGQEPYSILITLLEQCPQLRDWNIEIVATDISERALQQARNGLFNQFEVQRGLPIQLLPKYFSKTGDHWQIAETLRRRVTFHRHNLLDSFLRLGPPLDIVFLRNVLIYFEPSSKTELFQRLRQSMAPDGFLVLGETESTLGITNDFHLNNACRDFYQPAI
jgi:chemotaxis protein methyltransferase CheR